MYGVFSKTPYVFFHEDRDVCDTSTLTIEILKLDKVPFYCSAWSNIKSVRNAIKSGFKPAWAELTAKDGDFVDKMNKKIKS